MTVYLLHLEPPLRHSRHYVGYARDERQLEERLKRHRAGTGGALLRPAVARGSTISLAHVWPDAPQEFERYVKSHGGAGRWCPLCGTGIKGIPSITRFEKARRTGIRKGT